jgi:hypothetical protein
LLEILIIDLTVVGNSGRINYSLPDLNSAPFSPELFKGGFPGRYVREAYIATEDEA